MEQVALKLEQTPEKIPQNKWHKEPIVGMVMVLSIKDEDDQTQVSLYALPKCRPDYEELIAHIEESHQDDEWVRYGVVQEKSVSPDKHQIWLGEFLLATVTRNNTTLGFRPCCGGGKEILDVLSLIRTKIIRDYTNKWTPVLA